VREAFADPAAHDRSSRDMTTWTRKWRRSVVRSIVSAPETEDTDTAPKPDVNAPFVGSLQLRHVDAGSCNGCEIEIASAFGPVYDAARFGARLVASPRHADGLLVTGVVTKNMSVPLRKTLDAVPRPMVIVACGDCAINGGVFSGSYAVAGIVADFAEPDVTIPGCPPHPEQITRALRSLTGR
jgi:Ni,Fe-hydrogenase III small subunit